MRAELALKTLEDEKLRLLDRLKSGNASPEAKAEMATALEVNENLKGDIVMIVALGRTWVDDPMSEVDKVA